MSTAYDVQRLRVLQQQCGSESTPLVQSSSPVVKIQADTSRMTPYEAGQYRVACRLRSIRQSIAELDALEKDPKASQTSKSLCSQQIRKDIAAAKKETGDVVLRHARQEDRKPEYDELVKHLSNTEAEYKRRFRTGEAMPSASLQVPLREECNLDDIGQSMHSLREDAEFESFFLETQRKDAEIDKLVERLGERVASLHLTAVAIHEEVETQIVMIKDAEDKTEKATSELKGVNKKLKKTIVAVEKDRICCYLFCFLLLLAVAATLAWILFKRNSGN